MTIYFNGQTKTIFTDSLVEVQLNLADLTSAPS